MDHRRDPAQRGGFSLTWADRYTSTYDVTWTSVFALADLVYTLSSLPGVTITSVDVDSRATDETGSWRVSAVQQWRQGEWVALARKAPAVVKAGKTLRLRTVLAGATSTKKLLTHFRVPQKARGVKAVLAVGGGSGASGWVQSLGQAEKMIGEAVRQDQLRVQLGTSDAVGGGGGDDFDVIFLRGRPRPYSFSRTSLLGPLDKVVEGSRRLKVRLQ